MTLFTPTLLTDKTRLQEIYDLRVVAYEDSSYNNIINSILYPNGWYDFLDETSFHWIIENEGQIIASARLSIIHSFDTIHNLGIQINEDILPMERPFGLFSRLIISKQFRSIGLSKKLDQVRISKLFELGQTFGIATCHPERLLPLIGQNFKKIGEYIDKQNIVEEKLSLLIIKQ